MLLRNLFAVCSAAVVLSLVFGSGFAIAGQTQPVYSVKNLGEQQDASGKSFMSVEVKCNVRPDLRYIEKASGSKVWCVAGMPDECDEDRIGAASKACVSDIPENTAQSSESRSEATLTQAQLVEQAERRALESELIRNQQRKLELNNRQLELRKLELDLLKQQSAE